MAATPSQINLSLDSSKLDSPDYLVRKLLETKLQVIYVISQNTTHNFGDLIRCHVPEIQALNDADSLLSKYSTSLDSIFNNSSHKVVEVKEKSTDVNTSKSSEKHKMNKPIKINKLQLKSKDKVSNSSLTQEEASKQEDTETISVQVSEKPKPKPKLVIRKVVTKK